MRTLTAICHLPIKACMGGTFSAVASRLGGLRSLGFDGMILSDFDDSCGTSQDMIALVAQAHALGFCVIPDLSCLTGGVDSPAPFLDAAIGQFFADGFVMSEADMRFEDVRPTVQRWQKDRETLWFMLNSPPEAGARSDGMARRGFAPWSVLSAVSPEAQWCTQSEQIGKTRLPLATVLPYAEETTAQEKARFDAAIAAACFLPGVPVLPAQSLYAVSVCPDDRQAFAMRRRLTLLKELLVLRRRHPALAAVSAWKSEVRDGIWSVTRRTGEGALSLYINTSFEPAAISRVPRVKPLLSCGLFSRSTSLYLLSGGYAAYSK